MCIRDSSIPAFIKSANAIYGLQLESGDLSSILHLLPFEAGILISWDLFSFDHVIYLGALSFPSLLYEFVDEFKNKVISSIRFKIPLIKLSAYLYCLSFLSSNIFLLSL